MARYRMAHNVRHRMYLDVDECARSAAAVFSRQQWRWNPSGEGGTFNPQAGFIPNFDQIKAELEKLRQLAHEGHEYKGQKVPGTGFASGGRLMYQATNVGGEFGHEVGPKNPEPEQPIPLISVQAVHEQGQQLAGMFQALIDTFNPDRQPRPAAPAVPEEPIDPNAPARTFRHIGDE